jgi:tRNA(fMet)-specific endonuclease VapC
MAVLVDTSVLIDAERRSGSLDGAVGEQERAISVITMSEILHGVHRATDDRLRLRREAFVERLLASIEALPVTPSIARVQARVWASLCHAGTQISAHDMWIAATALSHGMGVATANVRDFKRVPGLVVVPV